MTNISTIENKISSINKYLKILSKYKKYSQKEIESSDDLRGCVERYLYLAAQSTIELADATISFKNFRKPSSLKESFEILKEEEIIDFELFEKMAEMVGFRNIIAHDYAKIDYNIVYNVLQNELEDIKEFIKKIKKL